MIRMLQLKSLKNFAKKKLNDYPITHDFILGEVDTIPLEEFIIKVKIWLQLLEKDLEMKK